MTLPPDRLAQKALDHVLQLPGGRKLIAIAGPPGSGKSTIAGHLDHLLQARGRTSAVVPMDGFHLDNALLKGRGLLDRKGAAETFDATGFCHLVQRIATGQQDVVYPVFDRHRDIAIAGAAVLPEDVEFVIFEGNYLVLTADPWHRLAKFWTSTIWIEASNKELEGRLVARWVGEGYSDEDAQIKVTENDLRNCQFIQSHSRLCDLVLPC
jgi:pantothenate kinase